MTHPKAQSSTCTHAGAHVAALDVDEEGLRELSATFAGASAKRFLSLRTDIADYTDCERAVVQTRAALGGVHILINNGALGMGVIRADCIPRTPNLPSPR